MSNPANKSYRWLFCLLAVLGLCLDQGSKYGVFGWLTDVPARPPVNGVPIDQAADVIPDVFYLSVKYSDVDAKTDDWRSPLRTISSDVLPEVNHGALWGIGGRDDSGSDFNHIFALVSVLAAGAIVIWSLRATTASDRWLCLALGLILAGTLGNLYDRVVFYGVRDFLQWVYLFGFPRFNVADSCLVCGASVLLLQAFFATDKSAATTTTAVATAPIPQPEAVEAK